MRIILRKLKKLQILSRRNPSSRLSSVFKGGNNDMATDPKGISVHLNEEELASGKWLGLTKVTFRDPLGRERTWEALRRMTKKPDSPVDAVIIIPILKRSLHYDCLILVKQYRPPTKRYTLEFPAGLMDANESVETCALRELKEETGYSGVAKHSSPVTSLDPGTSNTTGQIVTVEIDGDLQENQIPKAQPDDGEFIEVLTIPKDDFLKKLNEYTEKGVTVDARLYMYAIALEQTRKT